MIIIDFKPIQTAMRKSDKKKKDIAKSARIKQDTLYHFLNSGKKLKKQLNTLNLLCIELNIPIEKVIVNKE